MIKNFFLLEASQPNISRIIQQIKQAVANIGYKPASENWIAGILQELGANNMTLLNKLRTGKFEDEKEQLEASTRKAVYDVLASNNLIKKNDEYSYSYPPPRDPRRDILSKIKSEAPGAVNRDAVDRFGKQLKSAEYSAIQDFRNSLDEKQKEAFDAFNELNESDIAMLKHLADKRDEYAKLKKSYTPYVLNSIHNGKGGAERLLQLGFINVDGTINLQLLHTLEQLFIDNKNLYKLKPETLYYQLKRLSSDATYSENSLVKRLSATDIDSEAENIVKNLDEREKDLLLQNKVTKKLKDMGLVKDGKFTDLGKAVKAIIRTGRDNLSSIEKDIKNVTGRTPDHGPLDPSTPDRPTMYDRNRVATKDYKGRFSRTFNNRKK